MSTEILAGIFGLIGAIIGSIITVIAQYFFELRKEYIERKSECIKKLNIIPPKLNDSLNIINLIIDFIDADFSIRDDYENSEIYNKILNLYTDKFLYFWDTLILEIYSLLPKTSKTIYFQILNEVICDTKNMSEKNRDYLESQEDFNNGLYELQSSFEYHTDKYITSKYAIYKLLNEYYEIFTKNKLVKNEMKIFYKRNKKIIKKINKNPQHYITGL